ncbi:MAG: GTP pyrophosphokinase family protein [Clostridiales bacterium]|nr:GTP pyrophosphokinase family protein [Clostridiales bacterium]
MPSNIPEKVMPITQADSLEWLQQQGPEFIKLMSYYRCAMMEIETKFHVLDVEYSLLHHRNPISAIKSRLKTPSSIQDKLKRRGIPCTLETVEKNLMDVAGVRVICSFNEDVYTLADALLRQDDITLISRKDYIADPKENGYRSLHLIVSVPIFLASEKRQMMVEIQLRTIAMDCWATLEHQLRYKKNRQFTREMAQELYECAWMSAHLDQRMDALRQQVEQEDERGQEDENQ